MTTLVREKCVACRRDSPRVTEEEVSELHPQVSEWDMTDTDGIPRLQRTFRFRDFGGALDFATELGKSADAEGHHPRITVEWGRVGVDWWTHKDSRPASQRLHNGSKDRRDVCRSLP